MTYHIDYNRCLRYSRPPITKLHPTLAGTEAAGFLQHLYQNHPHEDIADTAKAVLQLPGGHSSEHLYRSIQKHDPKLLEFVDPLKLSHYLYTTKSPDRKSNEIDNHLFKNFDTATIPHSADEQDFRPAETIPEDFYS